MKNEEMDPAEKRQTTPGSGIDHEWCLLCGSRNPHSLRVKFEPDEEGVKAVFAPSRHLQGYRGILHGGIVSSLLDAAMTHCLFHRGIKALTADLRVRFYHSVPWEKDLLIRARITRSRPPLYLTKAEIIQDERIMAEAEGKFMRQENKN